MAELHVTHLTGERAFTGMNIHMFRQIVIPCEFAAADGAAERPIAGMSSHVNTQAGKLQVLTAHWACN